MVRKHNVVVLVSGRGSNLQAIIDHFGPGTRARHQATVNIAAVISNDPQAPALDRARNAGIPTKVRSHRGFPNREAFDAALIALIDRYQPALVVLAGFMRILSASFVRHYQGKLINIHPSLLPEFPGLDTHRRAIEARAREHGATVHFVSEGVDEGPIILQARVPVSSADTPESLAARVLCQEHRILPQAIAWFTSGRLECVGGQALLDGCASLTDRRLTDF